MPHPGRQNEPLPGLRIAIIPVTFHPSRINRPKLFAAFAEILQKIEMLKGFFED